MTVDGCVYERSYIEQWIRHRQQQRLRVTSPATNQELPSHRLVSLTALQKAIEAYLGHRPELRSNLTASRSFEEAAQMLQSDLLEKQAAQVGTQDELSLLRDSNEVLIAALSEAERATAHARKEVEITRKKFSHLEAEYAALKDQFEALQHHCGDLSRSLREAEASRAYARFMWGVDKVLLGVPSFLAARANSSTGPCGEAEGATCVIDQASTSTSSSMGAVPSATKSSSSSSSSSKAVSEACSPDVQDVAGHQFEESPLLSIGASLCSLIALAMVLAVLLHLSGLDSPSAFWSLVRQTSILGRPPDVALATTEASLVFGESLHSSSKRETKRRKEEGFRKDERPDRREEQILKDGSGDGPRISVQTEEAIHQQVTVLRRGSQEEKTEAALVLSILATHGTENQAAIVRAGAVSQLVDLLRGDFPHSRAQAAVALQAIAANNTYNKVATVRAGAIPLLIRLLQEDPVEVQEVAAHCLQTLAETNSQVEIAQAGAIVPLVALLKDERPGVREEAAGALVILALNTDNQVAIAQVGAVPLLVDLLQDDSPEVREQAAAALRNLAAENLDNQAAIAKAGAFAPLADLLKDEQPGVREEALAALRNLAGVASEEAVHHAAVLAGLAIREHTVVNS